MQCVFPVPWGVALLSVMSSIAGSGLSASPPSSFSQSHVTADSIPREKPEERPPCLAHRLKHRKRAMTHGCPTAVPKDRSGGCPAAVPMDRSGGCPTNVPMDRSGGCPTDVPMDRSGGYFMAVPMDRSGGCPTDVSMDRSGGYSRGQIGWLSHSCSHGQVGWLSTRKADLHRVTQS